MKLRRVVVAHSDPILAEALAAALRAFPGIAVTLPVWTAADALRAGAEACAAIVDDDFPGAAIVTDRLSAGGLQVIWLGEPRCEDECIVVSKKQAVEALARALVPHEPAPNKAQQGLTKREREVMALVSRGMAGKQVASRLGISPKTVEHYKTRIFSKLGVPNQTAAACLLIEHGMPAMSSDR